MTVGIPRTQELTRIRGMPAMNAHITVETLRVISQRRYRVTSYHPQPTIPRKLHEIPLKPIVPYLTETPPKPDKT